jgi:polar amino acid transport system substrate-binding protein
MRRTRTLPALAVALLATVTAGCGGDEGETVEGGVELVKAGQLTVCTHLPYPPFQFTRGDEVVGFDVDLMDLVADELGVEQEILNTPFEGIETGETLNTMQCDAAAAGMTITEEREEVMDFSDPYFDATQALITPKGSGLASLEDLSGKRLGVQVSTTGQEYAQDNAPADVDLVQFEDLALLLAAVKNGQVDAGINDNGVLYDYVKDNPDVEVTAEFDTNEQYGVSVKTDNTELLDAINKALSDAREDGTYDEIYQKWFGTTPGSA